MTGGTSEIPFHVYQGQGTVSAARGLSLPHYEKPARMDDPSCYVAGEGLRDAVNVAIALGQPLLLTGEPGTGKTQLPASVAWELGLPGPLIFNTKTTSTARDLFYRYDSLRHFHDAQFRREARDVDEYLTYEALGLSILLSKPAAESDALLPPHLRGLGPARTVVLIDEVDKAPRDLPNDLLNEIEQMEFTVHENGRRFKADIEYRPFLVLTSNSERNLPDAFLRRCVFYHISFPDRARLREIVQRRLTLSPFFSEGGIEKALEHFEAIRALPLRKKPATAECLAWIRILDRMKIDPSRLKAGETEALALSYSALAKNSEDLEALRKRKG